MGSTVIDRVIVDELRERVEVVGARASNTERVNTELRTELESLHGFADEARDQLVLGRLRGVPVLVVAVQGVERRPVDAVRQALAAADAVPAGTLLFTNKLRLDNDADMRALASTVGANPAAGPESVRRQALTRLAAVLDGTANDATLLPALAAGAWATSAWAKGMPTRSSPTSAPSPDTTTSRRLATGNDPRPRVVVVAVGEGGS